MEKGHKMKFSACICIFLSLIGICSHALAVETGMYRLLSVSDSEKLILVSQIPSKQKYLLDIASAKITVDGKPAELKELDKYAFIQIKIELRKSTRNGVEIDGSAKEVKVISTDKSK
jgi:hypothetical protein